jgi:glycine cleavage system aminomethyltransferase T
VSALDFLSPAKADDTAIARSPMERKAQAAGARFEVRDGWNVAVEFPGDHRTGGDRTGESVAWADVSHLRKLELRGDYAAGDFGTATRSGDAWWCRLTGDRALGVGVGGSDDPPGALDVTCNYAALTILGRQAREVIARFCALDLRPQKAPPQSFRPGSIARQPGMIVVESEDRFLLLFGWAVAEYVWTVVADAAKPFGGNPIGVEALARATEVPASA